MATSIPRSRSLGLSDSPPLDASERGGITLTFPGKQPASAVLSTSPAQPAPLWSSEASGAESSNRLYFGDNLPLLAHLLTLPNVRRHVRLIYIDPPYATGGVFESRTQHDAYTDTLLGAGYLESLRQRLILLRELLADDGSIYVHLDKNMAFTVKLVMDELFGPRNFRAWITRKKCNPKNYTSRTYGNVADYLLFYSKTENYCWNRPVEAWTDARALKEYQYVDTDGRRYKKVPVHAPGVRHGETGKPWRGMLPPPGKHWQYQPDKLDAMDARGEIYWSPTGNPRRKVFLENSEGVPVQDIWMEFRDAHNQNIKVTGFPTEKNPQMLERIIAASSDPGDLVLDCFTGSGTTLAVADALGRRWIGMDNSPRAILSTLTRFAHGTERMGDFVSERTESVAGSPVQADFGLEVAPAPPPPVFQQDLALEATARPVMLQLFADEKTCPKHRRLDSLSLSELVTVWQDDFCPRREDGRATAEVRR